MLWLGGQFAGAFGHHIAARSQFAAIGHERYRVVALERQVAFHPYLCGLSRRNGSFDVHVAGQCEAFAEGERAVFVGRAARHEPASLVVECLLKGHVAAYQACAGQRAPGP